MAQLNPTEKCDLVPMLGTWREQRCGRHGCRNRVLANPISVQKPGSWPAQKYCLEVHDFALVSFTLQLLR